MVKKGEDIQCEILTFFLDNMLWHMVECSISLNPFIRTGAPFFIMYKSFEQKDINQPNKIDKGSNSLIKRVAYGTEKIIRRKKTQNNRA